MFGVSATALAQQEAAFLWPRLALSLLPFLLPPRLCVYFHQLGVWVGQGVGVGAWFSEREA